jgi:hypothetical protein
MPTKELSPTSTTSSTKLFRSSSEFSQFIEKRATENGGTYVDTILEFCEENNLEPNDVSNLISKSLKDKLEVDFGSRGMLKRTPSIFDDD